LLELRPGGSGSPFVRFVDTVFRPFLITALLAIAAVQLPRRPLVAPALTFGLLAFVAAMAVSTLFSWAALSQRQQTALCCTYTVSAAALLPLAGSTTATAFVFVSTAVAGVKLASHRVAIAVAAAGVVTCVVTLWVLAQHGSSSQVWPWWMSVVVGIPVYMGIANRDGQEALLSAERAAAAAKRAAESEAREAALVERARIAGEIGDVLGHSLSGIALQLDMADALAVDGRGDEANLAARRARALAVGSITETRRAVQALREDTRPPAGTLPGAGGSGRTVDLEVPK
jgi:signal transduction histidine kinase